MIGRGRFVLAFLITLFLTLYAMVPLLGTPLDDEHLRSLTWMDAVPLLFHGLFATYFVCVISRLAALRDSPSGVDSLAVIGSSSAVTAWVTSWNYAPMHALAQQVYFDSAFSAIMFVPVVNAMMWASLMTFGLVTIARFRKPVVADIRRDHQPCVTSPPAVGDERCDEPELSLL